MLEYTNKSYSQWNIEKGDEKDICIRSMTDEYSSDSTFVFNFSFITRKYFLHSPSLIRLCLTNFLKLGCIIKGIKLTKDATNGMS